MSDPEQHSQELAMPPGILKAEHMVDGVSIGGEVLPWVVGGEYTASVSKVTVHDGTKFLLSSVINSHKRLERAAEGMTDHQRQITDNMFYSRIAGFIRTGQSGAVDTMPDPATSFPIHVMRNKGGQRVYFGVARVGIDPNKPQRKSPVVMRLAVCDKNRQLDVLKVLSDASPGTQREKMRRSK